MANRKLVAEEFKNKEEIREYLSIIVKNLAEAQKSILRLTLLMLALLFSFLIFQIDNKTSLTLFGLTINNFEIATILIPLAFSYNNYKLFRLTIYYRKLRLISSQLYANLFDKKSEDRIIQWALPFDLEYNTLQSLGAILKGNILVTIFTLFLFLAILFVFLIPVYFQFVMLKKLYYYSGPFKTMSAVSLTLGIILSIVLIVTPFLQIKEEASGNKKKIIT